MVKRYPNGKGSGKMHSLKPGDTMQFRTLQEFEYKPNQYSHMTFIAGGSGITPIYQLTQAILRNPADKTQISLIYANNTPADILLREEFEDLERKFPGRFQKVFTVSKDGEKEGLPQGYVTRDLIQKATAGKTDKVLVSGPPAMMEAIAGARGFWGWTQGSMGGILKELEYSKEQVHKF
jgi:cytochrome-b5 reductase